MKFNWLKLGDHEYINTAEITMDNFIPGRF